MSNFASSAYARPLLWMREHRTVVDTVWEGYQLLNEVVLWGNFAWGTTEEKQAKQRRLLPRPITSWRSGLLDWKYQLAQGLKSVVPVFATDLFSKEQIDRADLILTTKRLCERNGVSAVRVLDALCSPASTSRLAYRLARVSARHLGLRSEEVTLCLILLRVSAGPLLGHRPCELCFRVSVPGMVRCSAHSRSKLLKVIGTSQDARTARAILDASSATRQAIKLLSGGDRSASVAGAIFAAPVEYPGVWRSRLRAALAQCPQISKLFEGDVDQTSTGALLCELRRTVDPNEWRAAIWPSKLVLAEVWLNMAKDAAPGSPPKGARLKTKQLLEEALALRKMGKGTAEIATTMNISRANLYQIFHRHECSERTRSI